MLYNNIFLNALEDHQGTALILSGVNAGAGSIGSAYHGGVIYLYNGVPPSTVAQLDSALSSLVSNTLLAKILAVPASNYGVTFAAASAGVLSKAVAETWNTGVLALSAWPQGANVGTNNLTIDYAIFGLYGAGSLADDGFSVNPGSWPRAMFTVGQIGTGVFDVPVSNNVLSWTGSFGFTGFAFQ